MRLHAVLPADRRLPGVITVEDDAGAVVLGPFPCRGKADGQIAAAHGNPSRDPTRPFGDHPSGGFVVVHVEAGKQPAHSYGPFFLLLDPTSGQALDAKQQGREGLAIHGGDPAPDGTLRATEGCLRTTDDAVRQIAALRPSGLVYVCD